ncbi:MAG: hypothetical protein L0G25_06865 [Psychrobacter sp.]|nr:hypothetical protein [Psychrobacter sp.]
MSHNDNLTITQSDTDSDSACELCACTQLTLTRHHLIPLAGHTKTRTQRHFSHDKMRIDIAMFCRP